jgi:hypothetical protein
MGSFSPQAHRATARMGSCGKGMQELLIPQLPLADFDNTY